MLECKRSLKRYTRTFDILLNLALHPVGKSSHYFDNHLPNLDVKMSILAVPKRSLAPLETPKVLRASKAQPPKANLTQLPDELLEMITTLPNRKSLCNLRLTNKSSRSLDYTPNSRPLPFQPHLRQRNTQLQTPHRREPTIPSEQNYNQSNAPCALVEDPARLLWGRSARNPSPSIDVSDPAPDQYPRSQRPTPLPRRTRLIPQNPPPDKRPPPQLTILENPLHPPRKLDNPSPTHPRTGHPLLHHLTPTKPIAILHPPTLKLPILHLVDRRRPRRLAQTRRHSSHAARNRPFAG